MSTSIDDLVAELKASDLWGVMFNLADAAGLPVSAMQELEAPRTLITTFSSWAASVWNTPIRQAIMAQFGDLVINAGRSWATLWGLSMYGVAPDDAIFAEGPVTITNTKGGNWSFLPFTFQIKNSTSGKLFTNTETLTIGPWPGSGSYPTNTVNFRALEPGAGSTSGPGAINTVVTSANGLICSNASAIAGQDEEPLQDFVYRARLTPALLSPNGPKAAFELVLRRTLRSDGSRIPVTRVRFRNPSGLNQVRAIVAGPSGAISAPDVARLLANVRTLVEPWGQVAQVVSAVNAPVFYMLDVYAKQAPTLTAPVIQTGIASALTTFLSESPIGGWSTTGGESGYIFATEIAAKASESDSSIYKATNAETDAPIGAEEVAVLEAGDITITFT